MTIFMVILCVVWVIALVLIRAMEPAPSLLSQFELQRRQAGGDQQARLSLRRLSYLPNIESLKQAGLVVFFIAFMLSAIATCGWAWGSVIALIVGLEYPMIARIGVIKWYTSLFYGHIEGSIIRFIEKAPVIFKVIGSASVPATLHLGSRQELEYMVEQSSGILTNEEKRHVIHSLTFGDRKVHEVMTPKTMIATVKKTEFLGPLSLNELHASGHNRLPVIDQDIDHIVGILHLQSLLALDSKRSVTAEKAMEPRVFYIREDQTLSHALAAFLRTRHHLFIVVNQHRETVGLISLEDVIEALIGRKIIDEFDAHDDLRAVALRSDV